MSKFNFKYRIYLVATFLILSSILLVGCGKTEVDKKPNGLPLIVTTSSLTADLVKKIGGGNVMVETLVPNGFDAHTYEPKPSEITMLEKADFVILVDAKLNANLTGLVNLAVSKDKILDLNKSSLDSSDYIYKESGNTDSYNPHTWTSPQLTYQWVNILTKKIVSLIPSKKAEIELNGNNLENSILALSAKIKKELLTIPGEKKMVVYHDAWEYFGKEFGLEIVGALQANNFAEPSAYELAKMADQIKKEKVKAFFGSEVFPSGVLEALESETKAKYIPNLADDQMPGNPGDKNHSYVGMMEQNLSLILQGLK